MKAKATFYYDLSKNVRVKATCYENLRVKQNYQSNINSLNKNSNLISKTINK